MEKVAIEGEEPVSSEFIPIEEIQSAVEVLKSKKADYADGQKSIGF